MQETPYIPVVHSQTSITELMIPSFANFGGKIHGGIILSLMDKVAYACATKHSKAYCVTASVDTVDFLAPVEVGDLVSLHASVNYVGNSSMVVGIKVVAENVKQGTVKHTNTSYFTMVAMDDEGNPVKVPGLILESKEQVLRFIEAMERIAFKKKYKEDFRKVKKTLKIEDEMFRLKDQRCEVIFRT